MSELAPRPIMGPPAISAIWVTSCPNLERWERRLSRFKAPAGSTDCITWTGRVNRYGYGRFCWKENGHRRETSGHRAAWLTFVGDIPQGLVIDHLCRNRICMNTEHMELVTISLNTRRGRAGGRAIAGERSGCAKHAFSDGSWRQDKAGYIRWVCRVCNRDRLAQRRARLAA